MTKEQAAVAEPLTNENDIKKRRPARDRVGNSVQRASEVTSDLFAGVAEAVSRAFRSFGTELTEDNVTRVGSANGFITGMVAGNASFFEELAKTSQRIYEDLKRPEKDQAMPKTEPIDYERLARLIAREMMKGQADAET